MHVLTQRFLLIGLVAVVAAGCSEDDTFDHDDVQKLYIEAIKARPTDEAKCVVLMTQVIEKRPMEDAYFHRGWIYAKQGKFDKATKDVVDGLKLAPEHSDLLWLDGELKKPEGKRSLKAPPSASK